MIETKHHLKKDIRRMRVYVIIWCAFIAVSTLINFIFDLDNSELRNMKLIEIFFTVILMPILIHSEPTIGTTAFWVTRPIDLKKLMTSKLLFILFFFILLPLLPETGIIIKKELTIKQGVLLYITGILDRFIVSVFAYIIALFSKSAFMYAIYAVVFIAASVFSLEVYKSFFLSEMYQAYFRSEYSILLINLFAYILILLMAIKVSVHRYSRKKFFNSMLIFISGILIIIFTNYIILKLINLTAAKKLLNIPIEIKLEDIEIEKSRIDNDYRFMAHLTVEDYSEMNRFLANFRFLQVELSDGNNNITLKPDKDEEIHDFFNIEDKSHNYNIVKAISNMYKEITLISMPERNSSNFIYFSFDPAKVKLPEKKVDKIKALIEADIFDIKEIYSLGFKSENKKEYFKNNIAYFENRIYSIDDYQISGNQIKINIDIISYNSVFKHLLFPRNYSDLTFVLVNYLTKEMLIAESFNYYYYDSKNYFLFTDDFSERLFESGINVVFRKAPHQLLNEDWLKNSRLVCIGHTKKGTIQIKKDIDNTENLKEINKLNSDEYIEKISETKIDEILSSLNKNPQELSKYIEIIDMFSIEKKAGNIIVSELERINKIIQPLNFLNNEQSYNDEINEYYFKLIRAAVALSDKSLEQKIMNICLSLDMEKSIDYVQYLKDKKIDNLEYVKKLWFKYKNMPIKYTLDFLPCAVLSGNQEALAYCIDLYYSKENKDRETSKILDSILLSAINNIKTIKDLRLWYEENKNKITFDKSIGKYVLKSDIEFKLAVSKNLKPVVLQEEIQFQNGYTINEIKTYKNWLVTCDAGGYISFWDKTRERCINRIKAGEYGLSKISFISDTEILAVTEEYRELVLLTINASLQIAGKTTIMNLENIHTRNIYFSTDGRKLLFDFYNDKFKIAEYQDGTLNFTGNISSKSLAGKNIFELNNLDEYFTGVKNLRIQEISNTINKEYFFIDANSNKPLGIHNSDFNFINVNKISSKTFDGTSNISDGTPAFHNPFAFSNSKKLFAVVSSDNEIKIQNIKKGTNNEIFKFKELAGINRYTDDICLLFSSDDRYIILLTKLNAIYWNIETGKIESVFRINITGRITGYVFDNDGKLYISDSKGAIRYVNTFRNIENNYPVQLIRTDKKNREVIFVKDDNTIDYFNQLTLKKIKSEKLYSDCVIMDVSKNLFNFLIKKENEINLYDKKNNICLSKAPYNVAQAFFISDRESVIFQNGSLKLFLQSPPVEIFNSKVSNYGRIEVNPISDLDEYESLGKYYNTDIAYSETSALVMSPDKIIHIPYFSNEIREFDTKKFFEDYSIKSNKISGIGFISDDYGYFIVNSRMTKTPDYNLRTADFIMCIYNIKTATTEKIFSIGHLNSGSIKVKIKVSGNKKYAALFLEDKIRIIDFNRGILLAELIGEPAYFTDAAFSSDDNFLYTAYQNGKVLSWNLKNLWR